MLNEAGRQKLVDRIDKLLEKYNIIGDISYSTREKKGIYQCIIKYKERNKWNNFEVSTGIEVKKGNVKKAKEIALEIVNVFQEKIKANVEKQQKVNSNISIIDFQKMAELNTTNYNPNKKTKADWDFYEYMEYWLYHIIKSSVEQDTFNGYERQVTGRLKQYFTIAKNKKAVKEITADDLDDFYEYLRKDHMENGKLKKGLQNATIDHYNDNISSAFNYLLKKKLVRYNPTDLINPITVERKEFDTYARSEIQELFDSVKGDTIELATRFSGCYGLRRSEIIGLRRQAFDFENNSFIINHVAIQNDGKNNTEKVYFKDKAKSKKGYRAFPLFPEIKEAVLERFKQIENNKELLGNTYNDKFDEYLFVHDNGDLIQPNYFTKRLKKIIKRTKLKKITPHGLRHSVATLLHLEGVDIRNLQDWLGHENITSTNVYTRSDYQKQIQTSKVIEKILGNKKNYGTKRYISKKKNIHIAVWMF